MAVVDDDIVPFPGICTTKCDEAYVDVGELSLSWVPSIEDGVLCLFGSGFSKHSMMMKGVGES